MFLDSSDFCHTYKILNIDQKPQFSAALQPFKQYGATVHFNWTQTSVYIRPLPEPIKETSLALDSIFNYFI